MPKSPSKPTKKIIIDSRYGITDYWQDIWNYRELLYFLSLRDILIRYKQTILGIAWSAIKPLLNILVFTVVFSKLAHLPSTGTMPYALMVCCASVPWQFFSNSLNDASNSLVNNSEILTKVYFPRMIIPISAVTISLVDFAISFAILLLLCVWYHFVPSWTIITAPLFLLMAFLTSLGAGFFIASLNVRYRDFKFILPLILQLGLFISPVGISSSLIPAKWKTLYYLNPMAGIIDGFRWSVTGDLNQFYLPGFLESALVTLVLFMVGVWYFRRMEKEFADLI